ncbi:MAG: hypothetical protein AAGA35_01245 [Patescibacteria group bacterium]
MLYNDKSVPEYMDTAGKITVVTVFFGFAIFALVFLFNVGKTEIERVIAQTATTTLTVLNTPPDWVNAQSVARELVESSTSSPTNSGDVVSWTGTADDSNNAPYFLIVCDTDVAPVPTANTLGVGTAPPTCGSGARTWAISASTTSGATAVAATTTTESFPPFAERNEWYAWVCDDDAINPRCNTATSTGFSATNTAPFHVNRRPVFTDFNNDGPVDPGAILTFLSTSSDPDVIGDTNGGEDAIFLVVCNGDTYSTTTNDCTSGFLASTSVNNLLSDATSTYTIGAIFQDQNYDAFGYIVDEHGHEAQGGFQGTNVQFTVSNVAPTIDSSSISIESGGPIVLDTIQGETTGLTLEFTAVDANSCDAVGGGAADEVTGFVASIFRSGIGSTTCDGSAGAYNANNCYSSGYTPWNLVCTASSTTCTGASDDTIEFDCTFPLWYIADPTDAGSFYGGVAGDEEYWAAAVSGVDDDAATGTFATSTTEFTLNSFPAIALDTQSDFIAYPALEAGQNSGTTNATSGILAVGNTGLDQDLIGEDMCTTFSPSAECNPSASSTIPADQQKYGSTTFTYLTGGINLSSSTANELELNLNKTISTSSPALGLTYWGIAVPGTITLAGSYLGLNTFSAIRAESADW